MLMNHTDTLRNGIGWAVDVNLFAPDKNLAFTGPLEAVEDIHQGRFAGTVFAEQGMNFTSFQGQIHVVIRQDTGKLLGDPSQF
jgi:hypothetical protein